MNADGKTDDEARGATPRGDGPAVSTPAELSVTFALVDVADRPLAGNPLAVVPDADWLDIDQMRRIARKLNQVVDAGAGHLLVALTVVILQGHAIGRPSRLRVHVAGDRVRLSGSGIVSGHGTLRVGTRQARRSMMVAQLTQV